MRIPWAKGCAILAVGAGFWLHDTFCEWRGQSYPLRSAPAVEARLLYGLRTRDHPSGNAARWDSVAQRNSARIRAWGSCYDAVHGEPGDAERAAREVCFATRRFRVDDTATQAVALGECEVARFGRLRRPVAISTCLVDAGFEGRARPRWTSDLLGPRHDEAYRERVGLWAERLGPSAARDRRRALYGGLAAPAALCGVGAALWARGRRGCATGAS